MPSLSIKSSSRPLDPLERGSEVLFGLIMVLTFTGSISVAEAGRAQIRDVLIGAIGCNFAWGIVDAVMYLMASFTARARSVLMLNAVRRADDRHASRALVRGWLPAIVSELLTEPEIDALRTRLAALPDSKAQRRFTRDDFIGAAAVFLAVFLTTLPTILPFLVMSDARSAVRASHAIVLLLLFAAGWSLGAHAGGSGWRWGATMATLGFALAAFTMVLGG